MCWRCAEHYYLCFPIATTCCETAIRRSTLSRRVEVRLKSLTPGETPRTAPQGIRDLASAIRGLARAALPGGIPLETVLQHRPIDFLEDVFANLYDIIWPHPNDVAIERRVVELA